MDSSQEGLYVRHKMQSGGKYGWTSKLNQIIDNHK